MILVFDLGNTRAHAAEWDGARLRRFRAIDYSGLWRLRPDRPVVYASVNRAVEARFDRAFRARRMGRDFSPAIRNRAGGAGMDRLANGVAAWARARRACAVVDAGTALTVDVVDRRGDFVGGLIAPGPSLQARSLHEHTALLPEIAPRRAGRAIGRDTTEAIAAGIHLGLAGLVKEALARVRRELGTRPRVYGTGGAIALLSDLVDEVIPALTLEGIAISASTE
jgi:pantothenate kinase type III